ncbi:hypothetical protein [Celeribacter sp.]|uniref:hypothetical protein n=1 Tax=Celeribacter sp. TaxID=1890673 RepID=UPI003A94D232
MVLGSRIYLTLCVAMLCGCQIALPSLPDLAGAAGTSSVTLSQSGITLRPPKGYCVDTKSLRDTSDSGFALMANCKALKGRRISPDDPAIAVLTASISAPVSGDAAVDPKILAEFFATDTGRAALARSGDASKVTVLDSFAQADAYYLHALDRSPNPIGNLSPEYWRTITMIKGRIVTLTVTPFTAYPLTTAQIKKQITSFTQDMAEANLDQREVIVSE